MESVKRNETLCEKEMFKMKNSLDRFRDLTWDDLEKWAGSKIVSRGKRYQQNKCVSGLAATNDGCLVAWVEGSKRYATKVSMNKNGLPESICTCPYEFNCKHGVAVVLDYFERIKTNKSVPMASEDNEILQWIEDTDDETSPPEKVDKEIRAYVTAKTKEQLVELVLNHAQRYPELYHDLVDSRHLDTGETKSLVSGLRKEIRNISSEPGWQNYWRGEGYTPDYSSVCRKLEKLLSASCADEVLAIGRELMVASVRQVGESDDEGETAQEISSCMPVIVKALDQSSLSPVDKLTWAVDAVLSDEYDLFNVFAEYLMRQHTPHDWSLLADRLLERINTSTPTKGEDTFSRNYRRDRLSDWAIHALECAGRSGEILPLCKSEAQKTGSFTRLVKRLITDSQWADAEHWILEGIRATGHKWPGIADELRTMLLDIRIEQQNWPAVAAIRADKFVRYPSQQTYTDCREAVSRLKAWPVVRECLLLYLENGTAPWKQKNWTLPPSGLDKPDPPSNKKQFPMFDVLIDIAIYEKKPDDVLRWYDQMPKHRFGWYDQRDDRIAIAIQNHSPDRAVAIWQKLAEGLIALVKPHAYEEAASYWGKVKKVLKEQEQVKRWEEYLHNLKTTHARKRRLMEILHSMDG
jgi:uncharacterized Zn finger protein